jgi:hypothetical protein
VKTTKFWCGVLVAACALSLAGADMALAQYGNCGRGQGGGRGVCMQNYDQSQGTCPNYQGQGRRRGGQGRQLRRRDGSCVNNPTSNIQAPAPTTAPAPAN